ncbi:DUF4229 domain-containing protein [Cellulomonas sp. JH27-2]|uniref:DUF4229 domain-containing protein n=1 Tax=Cellulomonas sp. JH27-2 TaxID=2774139 RepID=UPI0017856C79|nr:DUF4229 domain-containing protein [Cellulomonas sp. JH27-2]
MPVVVYTALRLLLFAVITVGLWMIGLRDWLAPLAALFLAWGLGYVLLGKQSAAAAAYVQARSERAPARAKTALDRDADLEDAADDAARAAQQPEQAPRSDA